MKLRLGAIICLSVVSIAAAQTPYHTTPDWTSADHEVSTGGALVDLDLDGWLDLVVSNGNDMAQQHVAVYYNQGDGTFPSWPDWESDDFAYNGHLDVADVNGDGYPDVAAAYLGEFDTTGPVARLYLNNNGTLSSTPDWTASLVGNAFGVAFGDMNNDGRPDLAVATGWAYSPQQYYHNLVYLNVDGTLASSPSWTSSDTYHYQGAVWVDANRDGWLDLAYAAGGTRSRVYMNLGGILETTASWYLTDQSSQDAIMVAAGDLTNDGLRDLYIADNNQLSGGSGRFRAYYGLAGGTFRTTASWTYSDGYCSAVAIADVNADGLLDLATGAWWDKTRIFFNNGSGLGSSPQWNSSGTSVVEKICFGDIDKNSLRTIRQTLPGDGTQRLFYLGRQPIQEVVSVHRDGTQLGADEYMLNRENGWITVAAAPTVDLEVVHTYSTRLDMTITNWDSSLGNYAYYNLLVARGDANCDGLVDLSDIEPFVLLLLDRAAYDDAQPDCDADTFCDMNSDGTIDGDDLQGFVDAIL